MQKIGSVRVLEAVNSIELGLYVVECFQHANEYSQIRHHKKTSLNRKPYISKEMDFYSRFFISLEFGLHKMLVTQEEDGVPSIFVLT